jgi:hypothetical protein
MAAEVELPLPYRPADFREHAADGEFILHWTGIRAGDLVEVKGLIENRGAGAVQGVTLALSSPGARVREESPGLIRPGQFRPFYFAAAFPGDVQRARLSVVAVERAAAGGEARTAAGAALPNDKPAPGRSTETLFADHGRDHFFTLHWNTTEKGGEIEVSGLIENRSGPVLKDVTLLISAQDAGGEILKTQEVALWGPFDKREARPFSATLPAGKPAERVSVTVASYQFYQPTGSK